MRPGDSDSIRSVEVKVRSFVILGPGILPDPVPAAAPGQPAAARWQAPGRHLHPAGVALSCPAAADLRALCGAGGQGRM